MRTAVFVGAALLASSAFAQLPSALTLDQCLTLAKQNSLKLRIAEKDFTRAQLALSEIRTTGLPRVKAKAGADYAPDARDFGYDPAISDGGQLNAQIEVEQSLYDGGLRQLKRSELKLDLKRLTAARRIADRDLTAEVKQHFIELLRAQREIELQQENVDQLTSYADLVQSLHHGGAAGYTDVLKSQIQLSNAKISLRKVGENAAIAANALAESMGIRAETTLAVTGALDTFFVQSNDSLMDATGVSRENNPELRATALDIKKSELEIEATKRERKPTVDLTADAGWLTSRDNLNLPAGERYGGMGISAGFTFTLPLFGWGATGMRVQQRQLEAESLRMEATLLTRSLDSQLKQLQVRIRGGREMLNAIRANFQTADQNYLLTKSTYAGGGTTATEVLNAQQALSEAKSAELETRASMALLSVQLEQITTPCNEAQP